MTALDTLRGKYIEAISSAADEAALEEVRLAALGKKGEISLKMRELGQMSPEERQTTGAALNRLRDEIDASLRARKQGLADAALDARLKTEWLDVTLPGRPRRAGTIHPVSQVMAELTAIFADMGFAVAEGPQVESDWFNFDALNIPPEHPARQEHDTFFMARAEGDDRPPHVLRTHTSPVQIRAMQAQGAPIRVIAPGRVYRMDMDQTHTPMFHQVEGLAIDRDISMANLKWVLEEFCRAFFEVPSVELRFRASHFPFTEPSAEVDIRCSWEGGQLRIGEGDGWLEILGSGMVHPKVLAAAGVNPDEWQGFAFGMGIDRIAMLKYGIPDLRAFFESDLRWLRHYGFAALDMPDLAGGLSR
ncbi:phenylalanine--tRNA ligase subunit alpha [Rhodobacter sphaeroides]|jgi:phenylalanyl-tRNA synthetase, alpha subunit (EC 6.1.1.20)|uniref:Phenylalanine--tRNA ligase alpha subunit n=3 Tax=Cereibacter sphaeroides TaxID=1063 RepID=SYFA_CERS4|nr:phenylalanine--tRNA ligase subunit alpha [Cereibacter sphaeroides]A3PGQ9.1 RecName: Full=Phenylalanine--tRNA ligase alpha subunit; AltName: Full=Phenylalanyl-tRNA synthetase alpha subunit; Short=PheRS [Cereibacter sphaeroides ATCC 17029]Q3J5M4.1 RecName: Full=Phenylalanine--tRNA ligase alpha subunit; AltName: Full=Phenylalanyl-tRNA synthetase alpha subunit; Short=PheRS [Cereibacter sphaeroides 2.4.1]EKX57690.1 Phenylalanyl-tRNA synthetase alpha chain [Rhodobacter sp. AKP1]ABA77910.1 phenylal